jgi:hypothetical protein
MAKKEIVRNVESFSVSLLDNGYTLQYSGYDENDDYQNRNMVLTSLEDLINQIKIVDGLK